MNFNEIVKEVATLYYEYVSLAEQVADAEYPMSAEEILEGGGDELLRSEGEFRRSHDLDEMKLDDFDPVTNLRLITAQANNKFTDKSGLSEWAVGFLKELEVAGKNLEVIPREGVPDGISELLDLYAQKQTNSSRVDEGYLGADRDVKLEVAQ